MHSNRRPDFEQLLVEAREGPRESLGTLLELSRNYLHLVARTQIDLHLRAQLNPSDLVQQTFLEAFRDFGQFRGKTETELLTWLRRILVHYLAHQVEKLVRAQRRTVRQEVSLEAHVKTLEQSAKVEAALLCQGSSPSAQAQRRELSAIVADQLAKLPATPK